MKRTLLASLIAVLPLSACAEKETEEGPDLMSKAEKAECLLKGGKPELSGALAGVVVESCAMPAPDEGKSCRKKSDCHDVCVAETRTCSTLNFEMTVLNENGEAEVWVLE